MRFLSCLIGILIAVNGSATTPLPVVDSYTGPALPRVESGSPAYNPGSTAANISTLQVINVATSQFQYAGITAVNTPATLDSTSNNVLDMTDVVVPPPPPPPGDGGPSMYVCGIFGWTPPTYNACGTGGFVMGNPGNCYSGVTYSCP